MQNNASASGNRPGTGADRGEQKRRALGCAKATLQVASAVIIEGSMLIGVLLRVHRHFERHRMNRWQPAHAEFQRAQPVMITLRSARCCRHTNQPICLWPPAKHADAGADNSATPDGVKTRSGELQFHPCEEIGSNTLQREIRDVLTIVVQLRTLVVLCVAWPASCLVDDTCPDHHTEPFREGLINRDGLPARRRGTEEEVHALTAKPVAAESTTDQCLKSGCEVIDWCRMVAHRHGQSAGTGCPVVSKH
eukprot:7391334-Prymnesium_polylepis.4